MDAVSGARDPAWLAGTRLADRVVADDLATLEATRQAVREGREQRACQVRLSAAGGRVRWFEVRYVPGVTDVLLVLLRDVTDIRRVAAEAEALRRITELANSVTDAGEAVRSAVADLRATLGWRGGRVLRVVDGSLEPTGGWSTAPDAAGLPDAARTVAPAGTDVAQRAVVRGEPVASDGTAALPEALVEHGVGDVVAVPVTIDGEVSQVLEFHTGGDVPIHLDHLDLLAQVGRQLGWVAVRQRALEEIERSHDELARSNAELERFAYVASHDLQEPLRKIVGFTELLEDHHEPIDDDEAEYRGYVKESAQRLQRLIKDLLAYSRAGRRELADEPVDLAEVTGQVLDDLALVIEEEGATVEVGDLPVVRGDDGQLREVLQNLVSNALKYRSEERPPYVTITEQHREEDDPGMATAIGAMGFIATLGLWTILVLTALDSFGIEITALVASLGIGGVAVALALQNVLGDLFASLSIVLDKPFVLGDFIIVGDFMGTVEHVGLKTTRIRSLSGEQLVFSNSDLLSSRIRNYKRMNERRALFSVGVTYDTPADKLRKIPEIIRTAVEDQENTRFDRSHFKQYGPSSLDFETVYYMLVPDYNAYMDTQQAINLRIFERFAEEGLEFAFPTRTVHLHRDVAGDIHPAAAADARAGTEDTARLE